MYRSVKINFYKSCTDFMQSEVSITIYNNRDGCFSGVTYEYKANALRTIKCMFQNR